MPAEAIQLWMRIIGSPRARRRGSSEGGNNSVAGGEVEWESAAAHSLRQRRAQWHGIGTGRSAAQGGVTSGVSVHSIAALQHESTTRGHVRCPSTFLLTVSGDLLVSSDGSEGGNGEDEAAAAVEEDIEDETSCAATERALTSVHAMLLLRALSPQRRHIVAVAAGRAHVALLTCSCEVWTWGDGRRGQLGHGRPGDTASGLADGVSVWLPTFFPPIPPSPAHERAPRLVTALLGKPVTRISCGEAHSMAATQGGAVFVWGANSHGQLGLGAKKRRNRYTPTRVEALHVAVTAGACAFVSLVHLFSSLICFLFFHPHPAPPQYAPAQRSAPPSPPTSSGCGVSSATATCCPCRATSLSPRSAALVSSRAAAHSSSFSAVTDRRCTLWGFAALRAV